jgi:hypothetical protein
MNLIENNDEDNFKKDIEGNAKSDVCVFSKKILSSIPHLRFF